MTAIRATSPQLMSRAEYRRWAEEQPQGRTELVAGEVVAMAAERVAHVRVRMRVWQALDRALRASGAPCEALGDGITIEVGENTDYEPDAVVNCGEKLPGDAASWSIISVSGPCGTT